MATNVRREDYLNTDRCPDCRLKYRDDELTRCAGKCEGEFCDGCRSRHAQCFVCGERVCEACEMPSLSEVDPRTGRKERMCPKCSEAELEEAACVLGPQLASGGESWAL